MLDNQECLHCNPIPVMLSEHEAGRQYVKGMVEALEQNNVEALVENARGYCYLLSQHIYKEDNVLYPMAEEALNESQKDAVNEQYSKVNVDDFMETDILQFIQGLENKAA
jgi:hemerythrin-like domain-containing protein